MVAGLLLVVVIINAAVTGYLLRHFVGQGKAVKRLSEDVRDLADEVGRKRCAGDVGEG